MARWQITPRPEPIRAIPKPLLIMEMCQKLSILKVKIAPVGRYATVGSDQYVHRFCTATCGSPPTNYTALTTSYQTLATGVAASGTQTFDLYITTPNPSTVYTQQSVDVMVQAVAG